jgi:hypothetical protein
MMLPESPSDDTRAQPSSTARIVRTIKNAASNEATEQAIPPIGGKSPLEAAMAAANTYVATLHTKLQPFLTDLIRQVLKDMSAFHFKSEKLKEMNATSDYVPAVCRTVGMKLQAVSEVTKSMGFKALEDELAEAIEATRRDWATRFVLPVFDMNVKALRRRFQLSLCRLLSSAAKGFIALVGTKGYDATVAVMDLLAMHGDKVIAALNVTTCEFLTLLKETAGTTIIPSPTVEHSLSESLHQVNGTSPSRDKGQEDGSLATVNAAQATAAAAANTIAEQLTSAKAAVAETTSHLELMRALVSQARGVADEATRDRATLHETLATARRARAAAIDTVNVAVADEAQCVAELNAADMDTAAAAKNQLALGAQALFEAAKRANKGAVRALTALRERAAAVNAPDDEGSVQTHGTTATPRSMSSISTTPTVALTTTITPGSILLRNNFRRAASLLHDATTAAIRDIDLVAADEFTPPQISRRATIINMLKTLLNDGIVVTLQIFCGRIADNERDRCIAKATVEPQLEHAAARIAAVVEAERPANRPTLKGLIHDNVDKTTEDLRRRIQSLEAKLGETKNALKRTTAALGEPSMPKQKRAKNKVGGGTKSKKTPGTAVAPSSAPFPKNKSWKRTASKKPTNKPATPITTATNDNASTTVNKKARKKATGRKPGGKGRGKPTAARN